LLLVESSVKHTGKKRLHIPLVAIVMLDKTHAKLALCSQTRALHVLTIALLFVLGIFILSPLFENICVMPFSIYTQVEVVYEIVLLGVKLLCHNGQKNSFTLNKKKSKTKHMVVKKRSTIDRRH